MNLQRIAGGALCIIAVVVSVLCFAYALEEKPDSAHAEGVFWANLITYGVFAFGMFCILT